MKSKNKKWILAVAVVFGAAAVLTVGMMNNNAKGISPICAKSEECRAAAEKEEEANQKKEESETTANAYQNKVNELSTAVSLQENLIAKSEERISELKDEIEVKKADLKKKQEALAEMLVNKHFDSGKEPIKILAGSNSISDLAEKASRNETAKQQVGSAAEVVKKMKVQLENDRKEVEELLAGQQEAKKELVSKRKEQQEFVAKYKNDAEGYEEIAQAAREEQQKAIEAYQLANSSSYTGGIYAGAYNSYPWQDECPYGPGNDDIGYPICQCTSYAAYKAREYMSERYGRGISISYWGNAGEWYSRALGSDDVVAVNHEPSANSVGQEFGNPGHVFWVESVDGNTVTITEYNNLLATGLYYYGDAFSGHGEDFGSRTISLQQAYQYYYIHFD